MSDFPSAADENPDLRYKRSVRSSDAYPVVTRDDGSPGCRRCKGPLPARKRTFCSEVCVHDLMLRCNPAEAAKWVKMRDKGICAACGFDTQALKKAFDSALHRSSIEDEQVLIERLKDLGFRHETSFYEVDHIIPVIRGGSHVGLKGFRTLCVPCHKRETSKLNRELADERRRNK